MQERLVGFRKLVSCADIDARFGHFFCEGGENILLAGQKLAGVIVDQNELLGRGEPVNGGGGDTFVDHLAQPRDAHGIELIKVGGGDRNKAQALQQRNTQIFGLLKHTPVEAKPTELAVHKAGGA